MALQSVTELCIDLSPDFKQSSSSFAKIKSMVEFCKTQQHNILGLINHFGAQFHWIQWRRLQEVAQRFGNGTFFFCSSASYQVVSWFLQGLSRVSLCSGDPQWFAASHPGSAAGVESSLPDGDPAAHHRRSAHDAAALATREGGVRLYATEMQRRKVFSGAAHAGLHRAMIFRFQGSCRRRLAGQNALQEFSFPPMRF